VPDSDDRGRDSARPLAQDRRVRSPFPLFLILLLTLPARALLRADEKTDAVDKLIPWLLDESAALKGIRFADVIAATSGRRVIPVDRADKDDQRILAAIGTALDAVLEELNAPTSKTRTARRVNEMSSHFENAIQARLNTTPGYTCDFPRTAAGHIQRSGYPDLVLHDKATGRAYYLDPKLFAAGSKTSSLRTFYFEPKRETNKVTEDARHLIVGIEHRRDADGTVRFLHWDLIDLGAFRVRLKAEFEGSNADLYRPEATVGSSPR
jgi:hypothetical protein